jgi:hypothetical protein
LKDGLGENRSGSLDGLAAGYYRIILELSYYDAAANLTKRAEKSQIAHIYPGMETDMNETFGTDAFSDTKTFTTLEAIAEYLDAAAPNSRAEPYYLALKGFDLSTDFISGGDPLGKLFNVLNRRFVTLDFSACTGDFADASSVVNRSYLVALVLPPTVSRIGNNLFYNAIWLGSVLWPESPPDAVIGNNAFRGSSLVQMSLPPGLKTISENAFYGCSELAFLDLPGTVESVGTYAFNNCTSLEAFNWPAAPDGAILGSYAFNGSRNLRSVVLPPSLTSIGGYAFSDCSSLESINLPQALTSIGNYAFGGCISLTAADVPPGIVEQKLGIGAFTGCTSLRSATLPEGLTWLYTNTFKDAALETITIPSTLENINGTPFTGCTRLRFVVAEGNTRYSTALDGMLLLEQNAGNLSVLAAPGASGNITIPEGVTRIINNAFQNNIFLTGITLPTTLTTINEYAFDGCSALRGRLTIPPLVASLSGSYTFRDCTALEEFDWPTGAGTPTMGNNTFQGCVSLRSVTLPDGLTTIASSGFSGCTSLESIAIPASVTTIPAAAFLNCMSLESIAIPAGVTTIAANAFQGCSSLESVTLPGGLTVINTNTFQGCASLRWVKWPVSGNNAYIANANSFGGCISLEKLELPDKLRTTGATIPANAFLNLSKLKTVVIHTSAVAGLGNANAFSGTAEELAIYVPDASVAAYQAGTNWSGLSGKIAEISALTDDPAGW